MPRGPACHAPPPLLRHHRHDRASVVNPLRQLKKTQTSSGDISNTSTCAQLKGDSKMKKKNNWSPGVFNRLEGEGRRKFNEGRGSI